MKRIFSLLLAALMLVSALPVAYATGEPMGDLGDTGTDSEHSTTITLVGSQTTASYEITVPAELQPGQSGTVAVSGTWASTQTLKVTAPNSVTLSYGDQTMDVGITFAGISKAGNDKVSVSDEATVAVADASATFGTWTGTLEYTVELV